MYPETDAWLPYTLQSYLKLGDDLIAEPSTWIWEQIEGRLNPGFSRQDAAAELTFLNSQQDRLHPGRNSAIIVTDGSMFQRPDLRNRIFWVIFLIMGTLTMIVVIACVNVTTLLLARANARQQEIAVRLAFGAGKLRLIRMLLAETLLLAAIAGVASVYFAYLIPDILNRWLVVTPFDWALTPDWRVFGYLAALTLLAGTLASLAPALQSLKVNLSDSLKGRQSLFGAAGRGWLRGLLIGTQVAVSLVLLVGAVLFVRAHQRVVAADFGFETRQTLAAEQKINGEIKVGQSWSTHHRDLAERVAAMPGVQSVAYARRLPSGWEMMDVQSADKAVRQTSWNAVSPGFFATLGIPIVRGRALQETDPPCVKGSCSVSVVVSEALAREFWPGDNPLGKILRTPWGGIIEVVGVARDTSTMRVGQADGPLIYLPWDANDGPHSLLARFTGDGAPLAQAITSVIRSMVRELSVDTRTIQARIEAGGEGIWKLELLIKILAAIAIALAIIGIYGLVSFAVRQRTREIGVRIALGARSQDIFRAVLASNVRPIAAGLLVGLLLSFAAATLLARVTQSSRDMLFTANAHDFLAYGVAMALLTAVTFIAMLGPARQAMKVHPMVALRDK
jgi:predicted permease